MWLELEWPWRTDASLTSLYKYYHWEIWVIWTVRWLNQLGCEHTRTRKEHVAHVPPYGCNPSKDDTVMPYKYIWFDDNWNMFLSRSLTHSRAHTHISKWAKCTVFRFHTCWAIIKIKLSWRLQMTYICFWFGTV